MTREDSYILWKKLIISLLILDEYYLNYNLDGINYNNCDDIIALSKMIRHYLNDLTELFRLIQEQNNKSKIIDPYASSNLKEFVNYEKGFSVFDDEGNDDLDELEDIHILLQDFNNIELTKLSFESIINMYDNFQKIIKKEIKND